MPRKKKTARKKTSAAVKKKISEAQKKRWAARKAARGTLSKVVKPKKAANGKVTLMQLQDADKRVAAARSAVDAAMDCLYDLSQRYAAQQQA